VVRFTQNSTVATIDLAQADYETTCASDQYYTLNLGDTEVIKLCPSTCAQIVDTSAIEIEIEVKCDGG